MPNGRPGDHSLTDIAVLALAWPLKDGDAVNFDGLSHVLDKMQACVTAQRRQT
jgi:hypothetical protein